MLKRSLCILLCLALLPAAFAAAEESKVFSMAGYDGEDSSHTWSNNQFFTRMEERTGISFTFQEYQKIDQWRKAKGEMFSSGELPDVFFKACLTSDELIRYTDSGLLIDLKPLLEENAPNLWALLQEHPEWMDEITLPNGKIGALPAIHSSTTQNVLWINQDWLELLGLSMPSDLESLKEVLVAFRDRDPNKNGKQDEIPLAYLGAWDLKFLSSAFGVVVNDYNIYLDEDGKARFWPMEDSFAEFISFFRELYAEKLIDPNGFTTVDLLRRNTDEDAVVTYGVLLSPSPLNLLTYEQSKSYTVLAPLEHEGERIYRDLSGNLTRGTFAISSSCSDPAALLRWVDVLYTEEGAIEAMLGKEGDYYIVNDDGKWQWKGGLDSISATELYDLSVYDSGEMPWLFPEAFYSRYADETIQRMTKEMEDFSAYLRSPFPAYTLTAEESAHALALQNELGRYVDESVARFVIGETDWNEETLAAFRMELDEKGAQDMIDFWQSVADRLQQ